jgi:hypothetical protein
MWTFWWFGGGFGGLVVVRLFLVILWLLVELGGEM